MSSELTRFQCIINHNNLSVNLLPHPMSDYIPLASQIHILVSNKFTVPDILDLCQWQCSTLLSVCPEMSPLDLLVDYYRPAILAAINTFLMKIGDSILKFNDFASIANFLPVVHAIKPSYTILCI